MGIDLEVYGVGGTDNLAPDAVEPAHFDTLGFNDLNRIPKGLMSERRWLAKRRKNREMSYVYISGAFLRAERNRLDGPAGVIGCSVSQDVQVRADWFERDDPTFVPIPPQKSPILAIVSADVKNKIDTVFVKQLIEM